MQAIPSAPLALLRQPETTSESRAIAQAAMLMDLASATVALATPVRFLCEWRYYVVEGQLAGAARYDSLVRGRRLVCTVRVVREAIQLMRSDPGSPVSYALDFGVLESGVAALVEANDGWALGLYSRSLSPRDYHRLLRTRWDQLRANHS